MTNTIKGLLIILVVGLTSCKNQQAETINCKPKINIKSEAKKLDDYFKQYDDASQIFKASLDKPSKVIGKQGTIIWIIPDDLTTENGEPLGKNVAIELKELTNQEQLSKSNAQTVSNGRLLVSGGAYYINITSEGHQLKLKKGKTLKVEFPKLTENEMFLFYGQRDSLGKMDWKQVNVTFKEKPDSIRKKGTIVLKDRIEYSEDGSTVYILKDTIKGEMVEKVYKKLYAAVDLNAFGWINCDRFFEIQAKTDLLIDFYPKDSINYASIFLVFKDINSIMQSIYFSKMDETINEGFTGIPIGNKVRLVAYAIKNEKILSFASNIIIKENQKLTLSMKETSDDQLKRLLKD